MNLSIRHLRFDNGERYKLLVDERGVPLYYPSLYISAMVRGASKAANTVLNSLHAIKAFYEWQEYVGIEFESSIAGGEFLDYRQVHAMRDYMQRSYKDRSKPENHVISLVARKRKPKTVSAQVQYARLSVIAAYIGFVAAQIRKDAEASRRIEAMVSLIKASRPKVSNKSRADQDEIYLDGALLDKLDDALKPGSELNPVKDYGVQVRNALMIAILRVTGMRRGELLNLKVEDINFSSYTLSVVRRPDAKDDIRSDQPVAKTRERTIPLDALLVKCIHDYVLRHRSRVRGAKRHSYLFVTHRTGPSSGQPLSISGFSKFMGMIKEIAPEFSGVHAHALRHNWNYVFSKQVDEKGVTPERERQLRSFLMGWNPASSTAAIYNKRHIKEQAGEAVLELQDRYMRKGNKE